MSRNRHSRSASPAPAAAPFTIAPPPPGMPAAVVETVNLAACITASITGAYKTCPRRACRQGCSADIHRVCTAEFPADADRIIAGMHLFLHAIPYHTAVARHALWEEQAEAGRRKAGAPHHEPAFEADDPDSGPDGGDGR